MFHFLHNTQAADSQEKCGRECSDQMVDNVLLACLCKTVQCIRNSRSFGVRKTRVCTMALSLSRHVTLHNLIIKTKTHQCLAFPLSPFNGIGYLF